MSFELYGRKHKNNSNGISYSTGTIYFYSGFAIKHIPSDISSVEFYSDDDTKQIAFKFTKSSADGYKLHRTGAHTVYATCKPFAKVMQQYGYRERQIYVPQENGDMWTIENA